jgi:hypothetical protein
LTGSSGIYGPFSATTPLQIRWYTYRIRGVPVTELQRAAHHKDILSRDLLASGPISYRVRKQTHLTIRGRRVLGEQHRNLPRLWTGHSNTHGTRVHSDRLPWSNNDPQMTTIPNQESANKMRSLQTKKIRWCHNVRSSAAGFLARRAFEDVAVPPGGQAGGKCRAPFAVLIIDGHKAGRACNTERELFRYEKGRK